MGGERESKLARNTQLPFILSDCSLRARRAQIARVIEFSLHGPVLRGRRGAFRAPSFVPTEQILAIESRRSAGKRQRISLLILSSGLTSYGIALNRELRRLDVRGVN